MRTLREDAPGDRGSQATIEASTFDSAEVTLGDAAPTP
jgi:hypothetical protein